MGEAKSTQASAPRSGMTLRDRLARAALVSLPLVAIVLLAGMIAALLTYLDRNEQERARASLLTDALWVEQTLRFQLSTDEDALARLGLDSGRRDVERESLIANARHMMNSSPEITSIAWLDGDGKLRDALPQGVDLPEGGDRLLLIRRATSGSIRPVYAAPRRQEGGRHVVDMAAPVAAGGGRGGIVIATIALDALLIRHVPWWIAENYDVRLLDQEGVALATKTKVLREDTRQAHAIAFDPPMPGMSLRITPYFNAGNRTNTLLIAAIFGLAALAALLLLLAHRHVRRRIEAESALRSEMAFRQAMEDSLTVGMRARDRDGRITYVNPAFCRMVGMEAGELIGRAPPMPYWNRDDLEHTVAMHDRVLAGQAPPEGFELQFRHSDGSLFDVLIYEAPLIDAQGRHAGWMGSVLDITDRKRAEDLAKAQDQSLQRTARLVTMGEMASTLAHELNQPLAAIASYAAGCLNVVRAGKVEPSMLEAALEKLGTQAQRAGQIIRRVHDFVRKREPKFGVTDVIALVQESAAFAEADSRKHGARIETEFEADLPAVEADRILIEQVLLNLIRNGIEAMAKTPLAQRVLTLSVAASGESVVIRVSDRGSGIAETLRGRLFEPFVSTKPDGMGMGLNICRSIVETHKGRLTVEPREGGGTVFSVTLPAIRAMEMAS